ncbi:MAG: S41 family peptidase [bacterium]
MKKKFSAGTLVVLVLVALFLGFQSRELSSADNMYEQIKKFQDVLSFTEKYYVEEVSVKNLVDGAIYGMIDSLDPHSMYFRPTQFARVTEEMRGNYQGVGLSIRELNDSIIVLEPMGGGPAARLGIMANDRIVKINDSASVSIRVEEASKRLRGPKGTRVKVGIIRPGVKELLTYDIVRDIIDIKSVDVATMINDEVGYISVNKFALTTDDEMKRTLAGLKDRGMKKLILDLRNNPGGVMEQAVRMADLFLDGGTKDKPKNIVYTKARRPEIEERYVATTGQEYEKIPLVILLNNASASASEIVAGAIQDWDRGLIVGETSFGKGLVQRQLDFPDGSGIRLTIARYYTPSGRLIQRMYEGKDKSAYQREAFERNEQEGDNLEHKKDLKETADTTRPMFKTNKGRIVYGGGGVTPDFVIKPMNLTKTTEDLFRRDLFYQFVTAYLDGAGQGIRQNWSSDLKKYLTSFTVDEKILAEFRAFIKKKEITINESEFEKDIAYIKTRIKGHIAHSFWANDGWYPVMLQVDTQFQKALSLLPEAAKFANLK